jgi:SRSO17 transposase
MACFNARSHRFLFISWKLSIPVPVYIWDEKAGTVRRYSLIATQTLGKNSETKISLSNVAERVELKTLAWMQLQRYWVERAFEDAKSECGMADYQVRKWNAWHHHMALVMMAMPASPWVNTFRRGSVGICLSMISAMPH